MTVYLTSLSCQPKHTHIFKRIYFQRIMNPEEKVNRRNGLWKRIREGVSRSGIAQFARTLHTSLICGKPEVKMVEEEKFLTNHELWTELLILEHRMTLQTLKLNESSSMERQMIKMANKARKSKEQFQRLEEMFDELLENEKVERSSK